MSVNLMEFEIKEIDGIEITVVSDNSIELWSNPRRDDVKRFFQWTDMQFTNEERPLVAGVGLSFWIKMRLDDITSTILFDAAESDLHMSTNISSLGLPLHELDSFVLSHGHDDHYGGLRWVLQRCDQSISVVLHPRMEYNKGAKYRTPEGERIIENAPMIRPKEISNLGGEIIWEANPILLSDGMILRTGEIPRITEYELGRPGHLMKIDETWEDDSKVLEDVSLVAKVREKGLVVITGCSHAGIVNIVKEARRLTGEERIYAIIGGFHLAGAEEKRDDTMSKLTKTIRDLKVFEPKMLVPCHCTGWRARHMMSSEFENAYVEGGVGHRFVIGTI